mgnify:CR=1 FL=1
MRTALRAAAIFAIAFLAGIYAFWAFTIYQLTH